jgi:integrase
LGCTSENAANSKFVESTSLLKKWVSDQEYKALLKAAGLAEQDFTFHSLRHTFDTALFKRGEHPKIVQSLLGQ